MTDEDLAKIAERVSLLMQIDRLDGQAGMLADLREAANVPAHLAEIFEAGHAIANDLDPGELYRQVNKRVAQLEAQLYLMRLEVENRAPFDPSHLLGDPLAAELRGARLDATTRLPRSFEFEPVIVAQGWHMTEVDDTGAHRWMAPGPVSVACIPHLGRVDQIIEISGNFVDAGQFGGLTISVGPVEAEIYKVENDPRHFISRLTLPGAVIESAELLPVAFRMTDFRQPSAEDPRQLGANISRFTCRSALRDPFPSVEEEPEQTEDELGET